MKRWWAVPFAILLLLLLWLLRGVVGGAAEPGHRPVTVPPAAPPAPIPAKPAPTVQSVDVSPGDTTPKEHPPGPPKPEGGVGVFGRVVRADRSPAADLPVTVSLDGKVLAEVKTDADGAYLFPPMDVPAGGRLHFVFTLAVRDGKGAAARASLGMGVILSPGEEQEGRTLRFGGCGMQTFVLREAVPLAVRVTDGAGPVEGATVWAVEETPLETSTEPVVTGKDGMARIDDLPCGRWTVVARARGRGLGRTSAEVPSKSPVEVALSPRVLEIEAVGLQDGKTPVEGVRFRVFERQSIDGVMGWHATFPPLDPPPTDSAGKTRLADIGEVELAFLPIMPGREEPVEGWERTEADGFATTVTVFVPRLRSVSWPVEAGERGVPPDGTTFEIGEERILTDPNIGEKGDPAFTAWMKGGVLVVSGIDPGPFHALARAPDGSLARISVPQGADRGPPIRFVAPRRLTVRVKDEDGKKVGEPVALVTPAGEAVVQPAIPDEEGKVVFEGLYAGEVAVCALARTEWGGAEVARVDLAAGDRTVEAVVGRAFTVIVRFRVGGEAGLPYEFDLRWLTPGPPVRGHPHEEMVDDPKEDAPSGTLRLMVRPWAPGKPVTLQVTVPANKRVTREIQPPAAAGDEVSVEIDLR